MNFKHTVKHAPKTWNFGSGEMCLVPHSYSCHLPGLRSSLPFLEQRPGVAFLGVQGPYVCWMKMGRAVNFTPLWMASSLHVQAATQHGSLAHLNSGTMCRTVKMFVPVNHSSVMGCSGGLKWRLFFWILARALHFTIYWVLKIMYPDILVRILWRNRTNRMCI